MPAIEASFNSKLVRLEVYPGRIIGVRITVTFQFQTGSIRSASIERAIKILSFNSKLVRLEGSPKTTLI